jgi:hypothetical protein
MLPLRAAPFPSRPLPICPMPGPARVCPPGKSGSQVTPRWRKQDSNPWSPVRGDTLRRNLALVEELKALAAALAARQISAGYAAKGGWGAVMARFIGATTDQGATHDRQGAPHQALGAIARAAPLFSTRLRWLCPATTRSFSRGPLASSLVMSTSYQTVENRKWQGPSHLPSSKRGDALSPAPVQLDA